MGLSDKLVIYGNWSGPGWTAGRRAAPFIAANHERILSPADREMDGVDLFDNFVSKAHDLNEIDAEVELRARLGGLGLINNETMEFKDSCAYRYRLVYDANDRFACYTYYRGQLNNGHLGLTATMARRRELAKAFANYFWHIAKSNGQFVTDFVENLPSLKYGGYSSATLMYLKLGGAGHLFLCEMTKVHDLIQADIVGEFGPDIIVQSEVEGYLNAKFISPHDDDDFRPVNGKGFNVTLTRKEVLGASARDFRELYGTHVRTRNATKPNVDFRKKYLRKMRASTSSGKLEPQHKRRVVRVAQKRTHGHARAS